MRRIMSFVVAALAGLVAVILVERNAGSADAFRAWYWLAAMPALCVVSAMLGYATPRHAWRWGATPLLAQWLWQLYSEAGQIGAGNLGPFAHVVTFVMHVMAALPCIMAAEAAAHLARKRARSSLQAANSTKAS